MSAESQLQHAMSDFDESLYAHTSPSPTSPILGDDQPQSTAVNVGGSMGSTGDSNTGQEQMQTNENETQQEEQETPRPWSELKTKAGKERKRLPLACIVCRRKKIRCSGEKPACKHCVRSRIPCVYKVTTRKAAPRTDYMAMLDKRLKRMEDRVIKVIPKEEHRDMAGIGRAAVKPPAAGQPSRAPRAVHKKRSVDEAFNAELNEWTRPDAASSSSSRAFWQLQGGEENSLLVEGAESLPPIEIQEHLAEVFFDCIYGQSYLLLHKPSFMRKLKVKAVPPVLILAVCAVSARFSTHPQVNSEPAFLRGDDWANAASAIALKRHDEPNITILTVFLILGLHEFGACHGGRSWSFGGQALRMAYALQLHQELDHDPLGQNNTTSQLSFTDREIRRRTMWACLLMDRYNSSGSQRPPIGNEKFMQIQLPIKESHFQMEIPGPTEDLSGSVPNPVPNGVGELSDPKGNMGVSAYIIRGIMIWGRTVDYLNLGGKLKDPHPLWSPESVYTKLRQQLDEFSATLPNHLAFNLENLRNHAAEKTANQFLFLHIIIHQNILFLNRFAIPLSPNGRPPKDIPRQFLSDAGRAAVEAAGHISILINQASGYMLTVPFAGYCAYAASTVHIWGIFSKNTQLEATSKENLRHAYRYLNKMKRYWGMFHYMVESTKERYRHFADAAMKGSASAQDDSPMFQYGDWFDKYPHGVSRLHFEDPNPDVKREDGGDAVMGQRSDLQSVEDFFASLVPPSSGEHPHKEPKRAEQRAGAAPISSQRYEHIAPSQPQPQQQPPPQPKSSVVVNPPPMDQPQPMVPPNSRPGFAGLYPTNMMPPQPRPVDFDPSAVNYPFNPDPLPQLDRQLVYDAYHGVNQAPPALESTLPINPAANLPPGADSQTVTGMPAPNNGQPWQQMPLEMAGRQAWPGELLQAGAWFLPFNLDTVSEPLGMPGANPQPGQPVDGNPYGAPLDGFNAGMGMNSVVDPSGHGQDPRSQPRG